MIDLSSSPSSDVLKGFKAFSLVKHEDKMKPPYLLVGGYSRSWYGNTFESKCESPYYANFHWGEQEKILNSKVHLNQGICTCGCYMTHDLKHGQVASGMIQAECVGWGICVEGINGVRCEFVRIEALFINTYGRCSVCYAEENSIICPLRDFTYSVTYICDRCLPSIASPSSEDLSNVKAFLEDFYKVPVFLKDRRLD